MQDEESNNLVSAQKLTPLAPLSGIARLATVGAVLR